MPYLMNLVYLALLVIASPWLLYAALRHGKYRQGWGAKLLGRVPRRAGNRPCIWLHAVSVGEVNLLEPLLFQVKRRIEGNTRPFFCYRTDQLRGPLAAAGLDRIHVRRQLLIPRVVHRKLGAPPALATFERWSRRLGLTALLGAPALLAATRSARGET